MRSAGISIVSIASQLGTTVDSVNSRIRTLGLACRPQFCWTPEADRWLSEYYKKSKYKRPPMKVILKLLNPSPTPAAAYQRASRLGLTIKSK